MFNGTASTLTSSSSTSLVLDQPSSTLPIPKIISLATIPSTQVVDEASISPAVHSATQQVLLLYLSTIVDVWYGHIGRSQDFEENLVKINIKRRIYLSRSSLFTIYSNASILFFLRPLKPLHSPPLCSPQSHSPTWSRRLTRICSWMRRRRRLVSLCIWI